MRRRHFSTLVGGVGIASCAWPSFLGAQPRTKPVVGFLHTGAPEPYLRQVTAFRQGLGELGYLEPQNLVLDSRWAESQIDRLPELATELVKRGVDVIAPAGGPAAVRAAVSFATTVPIVFSLGSDPVKLGVVASLSRPGGNVTGVTFLTDDLEAKRMEILCELCPQVETIGYLVGPKNPNAEIEIGSVQAVARTLGRYLRVAHAGTEAEIEAAFSALTRQRVGALLLSPDAFFTSSRVQLATLGLRFGVPMIDQFREFADAGGLISYGTNLRNVYYEHGVYVGRVLKGDRPATLPVIQANKFELVVNLKTAKALGFTVPLSILARADEVIE